jgi:hypothetical protein
MQEETFGQAVLPNRKERRRQAALMGRPTRPSCACCAPTRRDDGAERERAPGSLQGAAVSRGASS